MTSDLSDPEYGDVAWKGPEHTWIPVRDQQVEDRPETEKGEKEKQEWPPRDDPGETK